MFHTGPTERTYEYEESGKFARAVFDYRETDFVLVVTTTLWEEPAGQETTPDECERVREALWRMARHSGPRVMVEELVAFSRFVILRCKNLPHGFLANIGGDCIDYMERGKTLVLPYHEEEYPHAVLDLPSEPRWTYPEGAPIHPDHWRMILTRLQEITPEDVWIGHLGWKIHVPRSPPADATLEGQS